MPDFSFEIAAKTIISQQAEGALNTSKKPGLFQVLESSNSRSPLIVGIDEAGCGPWSGPVVAGAMMFFSHDDLPGALNGLLNDSKKLSLKKRTLAFEQITGIPPEYQPHLISENTVSIDAKSVDSIDAVLCSQSYQPVPWIWGIGMATVQEIDELNIRQATLLAMQRAAEALPKQPTYALVDGISKPSLKYPVQTIKKGDSLSYSIAGASILAKVYRDLYMERISKSFPEYGWSQNAGYGTKRHQEALDQYGVTDHHRKSFKPIAIRLHSNDCEEKQQA